MLHGCICVGFVVRDTTSSSDMLASHWSLAGLFLFIHWRSRRATPKSATPSLHVDLDLAFWQQYLQLNKNVKKPILQIDMKLTLVAYSFMMGDFDTDIQEAREALSQKELLQKYLRTF
ncbi:MAG: hypothetical protein ACLVJN_04445 [Streptococcus parasanguinis]